MNEQEIHIDCADWLRRHGFFFFHPANGGPRPSRTGRALRRMGVTRGIPDLIIIAGPPGSAVPAAVEVKCKGSVTPDQVAILDKFRKAGWTAGLVRSAKELERLLLCDSTSKS